MTDAGLVSVPEDATEAMCERGIRAAQTTRVYLTSRQAHDIWQAMVDEWLASKEDGK